MTTIFGLWPIDLVSLQQGEMISLLMVANAISYAKFFSRSHDAVIRVYNDAGNVIQTHEHTASSESDSA
jgi:hypothetical protein